MNRYVYKLSGPGIHGPGISAALLRDLLAVLVDGSMKSLRLVFEGRSTAPGKAKPWISAAAAVQFVGIKEGSAEIVTEAPSLNEALPSGLKQLDLFVDNVDGSKTCLDLFEDGLRDALGGNLDSDYYDDGLLKAFDGFNTVLRHGVKSVEVRNETYDVP